MKKFQTSIPNSAVAKQSSVVPGVSSSAVKKQRELAQEPHMVMNRIVIAMGSTTDLDNYFR